MTLICLHDLAAVTHCLAAAPSEWREAVEQRRELEPLREENRELFLPPAQHMSIAGGVNSPKKPKARHQVGPRAG